MLEMLDLSDIVDVIADVPPLESRVEVREKLGLLEARVLIFNSVDAALLEVLEPIVPIVVVGARESIVSSLDDSGLAVLISVLGLTADLVVFAKPAVVDAFEIVDIAVAVGELIMDKLELVTELRLLEKLKVLEMVVAKEVLERLVFKVFEVLQTVEVLVACEVIEGLEVIELGMEVSVEVDVFDSGEVFELLEMLDETGGVLEVFRAVDTLDEPPVVEGLEVRRLLDPKLELLVDAEVFKLLEAIGLVVLENSDIVDVLNPVAELELRETLELPKELGVVYDVLGVPELMEVLEVLGVEFDVAGDVVVVKVTDVELDVLVDGVLLAVLDVLAVLIVELGITLGVPESGDTVSELLGALDVLLDRLEALVELEVFETLDIVVDVVIDVLDVLKTLVALDVISIVLEELAVVLKEFEVLVEIPEELWIFDVAGPVVVAEVVEIDELVELLVDSKLLELLAVLE